MTKQSSIFPPMAANLHPAFTVLLGPKSRTANNLIFICNKITHTENPPQWEPLLIFSGGSGGWYPGEG